MLDSGQNDLYIFFKPIWNWSIYVDMKYIQVPNRPNERKKTEKIETIPICLPGIRKKNKFTFIRINVNIHIYYYWVYIYRSASFIVVQIHLFPQCSTPFSRVNKLSWEFESESNIVRASAPFPVAYTGHSTRIARLWRTWLMAIVTSTRFNRSFTTCPGYRMCYRCAGYRIDERCFSASCNDKKEKSKISMLVKWFFFWFLYGCLVTG